MTATVAILGAVALLGAALAYNRLVRRANLAREGWSGIDVQLKRRHDLVPNLVDVVRTYASYERELLADLIALRSDGRATQSLQDRENALSGELRGLLALAEAYPQLLANRNFLRLQEQLAEIEDQLQMARRYYNGAVRDYNTAAESFPSNLVAAAFRFPRLEFFQIESATERRAPQVTL